MKNFLIYAFCLLIFGTACKKEEIIKDNEKFESESKSAVLSSIAITTPATKLVYTVGDSLDLTGLVVTGTNSDNSKKVVTIIPADVTGFNSSAPAVGQVLTITIEGKKTTYTITVIAKATQSMNSFKITDIEDLGSMTQLGSQRLYWYYDSTTNNLVSLWSGYYDLAGGFRAVGAYINNTNEEIYPTGTIWYGDGTSEKFSPMGMSSALHPEDKSLGDNGIFYLWSDKCHKYSTPGTYHIKIEMTATFPDGTITTAFEKDLNFYLQHED